MKTVILGDPPPEIAAFPARRRALDQDRSDEVWEGDHHLVPAPHPWHSYIDRTLAVLLDPPARAAGLVGLSEFTYEETDGSDLLGVTAKDLVSRIDWPS
jgi:hypothetical protein